jgi:hypothetical protein
MQMLQPKMTIPPTTEPATMPGVLEVGVPGGGVIENDRELSLPIRPKLKALLKNIHGISSKLNTSGPNESVQFREVSK